MSASRATKATGAAQYASKAGAARAEGRGTVTDIGCERSGRSGRGGHGGRCAGRGSSRRPHNSDQARTSS